MFIILVDAVSLPSMGHGGLEPRRDCDTLTERARAVRAKTFNLMRTIDTACAFGADKR